MDVHAGVLATETIAFSNNTEGQLRISNYVIAVKCMNNNTDFPFGTFEVILLHCSASHFSKVDFSLVVWSPQFQRTTIGVHSNFEGSLFVLLGEHDGH